MYIKNLHIESFGPLRDRDMDLCSGLNIIEGKNESGKSTIAMFIKFMFYGLSGRATDGELSERRRFVNWDTGTACGTMTVCTLRGEFRIERELYVFSQGEGNTESVRERVAVINTETGERVYKDEVPGVALLGIPADVFQNTVFVRQSGGRISGEGLAESIENILMSGDESVSTKKAADALEKVRKTLRYKKGSGGRLFELEREEARLSAKLAEATQKSAEIIALEANVEELMEKVQARQAEADRYQALSDAYTKIEQGRRLEDAEHCRHEIDACDSLMAEYEFFGNIPEKIKSIHRLRGEITSLEGTLKELRRRESDIDRKLPPRISPEEQGRLSKDVKSARRSRNASIALRVLGIVFLCFGIVSGAALISLSFIFKTGGIAADEITMAMGIGGGAFVLVLAIVFLILSTTLGKKCKIILHEWDAKTIAQLEENIRKHIDLANLRDDPSSEYALAKSDRVSTELRRNETIGSLREILCLFSEDEPDTDIFAEKAIEEAQRTEDELQSLKQTRREWAGRLAALSDVFGTDDGQSTRAEAAAVMSTEEGQAAFAMTATEARAVLDKARFATGSLPSLNQQLSERNERLGQLRGAAIDPGAVAADLDSVRREYATLTKEFDAVVMALEALRSAGEGLRHSLMPRIVNEAGAVMGAFTEGKYSTLGVDRNFDMSFTHEGKTREAAYLSAGTSDIAYISLRCALLSVLFPKETPPCVYDESFAWIDEDRLRRILSLLMAQSQNGAQSIVFTCRSLEGRLAGINTGARVISLDK